MREIKFRMYNKVAEVMHDWDEIGKVLHARYFDEWIASGEIELMQYTGLKDKHGREIYEGDVLRGREYSSCKELHNVLVEFELFFDGDSFACAGYDFHLDSEYNFTETGIIDCEIIGNIYEQPELKESTNQR